MLLIIVAPTLLEKVNIKLEKKKIEIVLEKIFEWFRENGMKANQDKSHFLSSLDISKQNFH